MKLRGGGNASSWALPAVYAAGALAGGGLALAVQAAGGGLALSIPVLFASSGLVAWLAQRRVASRQVALDQIQDALERVARGKTSGRLIPAQLGELQRTGAAVNRVLDVLDNTKERMGGVAQHLVDLPERTADALTAVQRSAEDQEGAVEETASLLTSINTSIRNIAQEVEQLARSNDESASSILERAS